VFTTPEGKTVPGLKKRSSCGIDSLGNHPQTLMGKQNYKLTIIMGYQCVCNTGGEISAWTQEKIFMWDQQSRKSPNPRKQFIKDLIMFINEKRDRQHDIILNLDANEVLGEESQGIAKLMWECDLMDLLDMPELEFDHQLKDTYWRGKN
jgi:hypothetical protein